MLKILVEGLILLALEPVGGPQELWVLFANTPAQICEKTEFGPICTVPSAHQARLKYVDKGGIARTVDLSGKHVELLGNMRTPLEQLITAVAPVETPVPTNKQDFRWILSMMEVRQLPYPRVLKPQLLTTPYHGGNLLSARLRLEGGSIRTDRFDTGFGSPILYDLDGVKKKAVADRVAIEVQVDDPKLRITSLHYAHPVLENEHLRSSFQSSSRLKFIETKVKEESEVIDLDGVQEVTFSNHPIDEQDNSPHFLAFYHLFYPELSEPLASIKPVDDPDGTGLCGPLNRP